MGDRLRRSRFADMGQCDSRCNVVDPVGSAIIIETDRATGQSACDCCQRHDPTLAVILRDDQRSGIGFVARSDGSLTPGEVSCSNEAP